MLEYKLLSVASMEWSIDNEVTCDFPGGTYISVLIVQLVVVVIVGALASSILHVFGDVLGAMETQPHAVDGTTLTSPFLQHIKH